MVLASKINIFAMIFLTTFFYKSSHFSKGFGLCLCLVGASLNCSDKGGKSAVCRSETEVWVASKS